jgi:hypothetical protein
MVLMAQQEPQGPQVNKVLPVPQEQMVLMAQPVPQAQPEPQEQMVLMAKPVPRAQPEP